MSTWITVWDVCTVDGEVDFLLAYVIYLFFFVGGGGLGVKVANIFGVRKTKPEQRINKVLQLNIAKR